MTFFLDSCALIYWQEVKEPFYGDLMSRLEGLYQQHPEAQVAVSRLAQLECLVKPCKENDSTLVANYQAFFAVEGLMIIELSADIMFRAAHLRANYLALKTPDAIQAACALSIEDEIVFLTNDKVFERVEALSVQQL